MRVRVVAELVAGIGERLQPLRVRRVAICIAPDDEPRHVHAVLAEQRRRPRQRSLEDRVLELRRRRAERVDPVVAADAVEIDRDRCTFTARRRSE